MLLVSVDRGSREPAYLQIANRIAAHIEAGDLLPGHRLPPSRSLAEPAGVHRSTVVRAYDELRAKGYVESRSGGYTTVRRRARWPMAAERRDVVPALKPVDWEARIGIPIRELHLHPAMELTRSPIPDEVIDFEHLSADPTLAPGGDIRRCFRKSLAGGAGAALDYTDASGWHPLREGIATRMRLHGVAVSAGEVLVTSGAQHGMDLILRLLTRPGDVVVVEAPTYGMAHALFRLHELRPVEVPMTDEGMDLGRLEEVLETEEPRLLFTMPNFQNPTGITTSQAHREKLLGLCEGRGIPLIEDGFEEEMKYLGQAVLPIKSMDALGSVLYLGTFSKVVFPGLRVGWIAAPRPVVEALAGLHHATCIAGNTLAQAVAARFSVGGDYDRYLRRVHRSYRNRMQVMLRELGRRLPPGCSWTRPEGGYTVWLTLPPGELGDEDVAARCREADVLVSPGHRYFLSPPRTRHLRLSIARVGRSRIPEGCARLGAALKGL